MGRKPTRNKDMAPKRIGRPPMLDDKFITAVKALLASNAPLQTVADFLGVHVETLRNWANKGRALLDEQEETGRELDDTEQLYVRYYLEATKAYAQGEIVLLGNINNAAVTDWRAASWMLERTRPDKYGKIDRTEIQQAVTVDVDPTQLSRKLNELVANVTAEQALHSAIDADVVDENDDLG